MPKPDPKDFVKVEDGHFVHIGNKDNGKPCNSSVCPDEDYEEPWDEMDEPDLYYVCLGCNRLVELARQALALLAAEKERADKAEQLVRRLRVDGIGHFFD